MKLKKLKKSLTDSNGNITWTAEAEKFQEKEEKTTLFLAAKKLKGMRQNYKNIVIFPNIV